MKRFILFMLALFVLFSFSACRQVVVTSADELTSKCWCAENLSGMNAHLAFDENTATLTITGEEKFTLQGHLAVDSERFYITSAENFRTYTFSYTVFYDKLKVSYKDSELIFYPCESMQTPDEY